MSGIVADLLCADETADTEEVKELLKSTCADLGDEGYDTLYGYGLIDTAQCMKVLSEKEDLFLSPPLFVSDETAQFRIFGNTEAFDGYFFVLYYDEKGVLCDLTYTAVAAESRADISVSAPVRYDTVRCFILKDLLGLRPCTKERKIKVRQQSRA